MKSFIVAAGLIILLMFFPVQYALQQVNHNYMTHIDQIVNKAAQQARRDGYFTPENIQWIKDEISQLMHINTDEISITATTTPKYRFVGFDAVESIHYDVRVPIKRLIAMPSFWGIDDIDNRLEYPVIGVVMSEVLAP